MTFRNRYLCPRTAGGRSSEPAGGSRLSRRRFKLKKITQYKNPSQNVDYDIVKAETVLPPSSPTAESPKLSTKGSTDTANNNINADRFNKQGGKIPPHTKFSSPGPYHTIPSGVHAPHIPIGSAAGRPVHLGQLKKRLPNKPQHFGPNLKRKPIRGQAIAQSTRDEVFARPPDSAPFPPFKGPVKPRDTQGLLGNAHFSINPSSQIDFNNGFILPPATDNFQQFKSQPVNLVPPPPGRFQQDKEKLRTTKTTPPFKDNAPPVTESVIKLNDFNNKVQQFNLNPVQFQENLVPQLPPPFEQSFAFQKQFNKPKERPDVQVTKEKLKVFHSNTPVYPSNDYVEYDFHAVKKPENSPKLQTYEVTEGKWVDSPTPFSFTFRGAQQPPVLPQKLIMLPTANPQKFKTLPTAQPEPSVELHVPQFLPTPYRPEGAVPTSPTQGEVSTVFTQISTKMNRYKNEALTTNPLFFDVKEVSTHYPILGHPGVAPTGSEISNDISTMKMQANEEIKATAMPPTKRQKTRRRRPQPRTPPTTTIPTTTITDAETAVTENYETQKAQAALEEVSTETERPARRQRPKPNRVRINTNNYEEDATEKRVRGRLRHRQRGPFGAKTDIKNEPVRKRRPAAAAVTDESVSHETTESPATEQETQGIFESKYTQESYQASEEASTTKAARESELPGRHYEHTQIEEESKHETTMVNKEPKQTEGTMAGSTTEYDATANINPPENEVDYSTTVSTLEFNDDRTQTTLGTTLPTTSTTGTEPTTKSHRIRGRPIRYGSSSTRPRFSVKDYRQRLNQYTSTTPSTTTDIVRTTSEGIRLRFPTRKLRTRPTTSRTTTANNNEGEEDHPEPIRRGGFIPKEPRHGTSTTEGPIANIITEKNVKAVNTRLRPFGRYKSTTDASTTTPKVHIKPNLFSARRRPAPISLKTKIYGKLNRTDNHETTTYENEVELTEPATMGTSEDEDATNEERNTEITTDTSELTTTDMSDDDYSQRVSELTSAFKTQYETPGEGPGVLSPVVDSLGFLPGVDNYNSRRGPGVLSPAVD
ncbi:hypothetical protein NQ317_019075 [Molorchus minor]|uniref:Uncharacterized protein n=1 Tax=Molorchus minor TaxID=1323400 RepID=A0ABQ9JNN7_9CUCU|nr:hypothetical protein NQ317_019075 [Molorchus minor]